VLNDLYQSIDKDINEAHKLKIVFFLTFPILSGVGTTRFSSCCDQDSAIIFTTGLPDVNPHWEYKLEIVIDLYEPNTEIYVEYNFNNEMSEVHIHNFIKRTLNFNSTHHKVHYHSQAVLISRLIQRVANLETITWEC
jgi:hypothetical protein